MAAGRNPFKEIERLFEQMVQQFEESSEGRGSTPFGLTRHEISVDVRDEDDQFVVTADLPGFEQDQISVEAQDRRLLLRAESETETEEQDETYLRSERMHRTVQRHIDLPEAVDAEAATAEYRNGVLTVTLPKAEMEGESIDVE